MATEEQSKYTIELKEILSKSTKEDEIKEYESVLQALKINDIRTLVIIGVSYIEGIMKDIVFETFNKAKHKGLKEKLNFDPTLGYSIEYLYAKDMFTEEIYKVLISLSKIRNIYAHHPIIKPPIQQKINALINNIEIIISKGWGSRAVGEFEKFGNSNELLWLYTAIENLGIGMIGMKFYTIPEANMSFLAYVPPKTHLTIYWMADRATEDIMNKYRQKAT